MGTIKTGRHHTCGELVMRILFILTIISLMMVGTLSVVPWLTPRVLPNASGTVPRSIFFDDMETGGPAASGDWMLDDPWEVGAAVPPPNPFYGDCLATNLSGPYPAPTGYNPIWTPYLSLSLPAIKSANLTFWHYYDFAHNGLPDPDDDRWNDGGVVEAYLPWKPYDQKRERLYPEGGYPGRASSYDSGPGLWVYFPAYEGTNGNWEKATFDLSQYIGRSFYIRFLVYTEWTDGTHLGWYIDNVSINVEWFDGPIIRYDQTGVGMGGETLSYTLTIRNYNDVSADTVDIYYSDTKDWQVRILDETTYLPLEDNGGVPGLPDVYLGVYPYPSSAIDIIVNVTIPVWVTDWDVSDLTTIYVQSYINPLNKDSAELITKTPYPDVGVSQIIVPEIVNVGENVPINVTITNYGDWPVSFWVEGTLSAPLIIPPCTTEPSFQFVSDLPAEQWYGGGWVDGFVELQWNYIPTVACEYTFTVTTLLDIDQNNVNNRSVKIMYARELKVHWFDDMEPGGDAANGNWTTIEASGNPGSTEWEWGEPQSLSFGPNKNYLPSPTNCWGTDLNDYYVEDTDCYLFTPAFDFTGCDDITLSFYHRWVFQWIPEGDVGQIVYTFAPDPIDPGTDVFFTGIEFTHYFLYWENEKYDMTSFVAGEPYVRFGWRLYEGITGNKFDEDAYAGWYIDDVEVWASKAMPELLITEFVDNGSGGNEYIEVYNKGLAMADLSDYDITIDGGFSWLSSGTWSTSTIPPGGYAYYEIIGGGSLDTQGETIYLVNTSISEMLINDRISYGQKGTVPDPVSGESVARYWEGSEYADIWARDPTPTKGSENDGPGEVSYRYVVLNEVLYDPNGTQDGFIELRYVGEVGNDPDIDVSGWILVVGDSYFTIPAGPYSTVLNLDNPFYVINESMFSDLFSYIDINGDNIYLYDSGGLFVDEVGWSSAHNKGTSMSRVPDGFGVELDGKRYGMMGYDDPSSIAAGWQFLWIPTMSIVSIEADQISVGDLGWTIVYDLTIANHQNVTDYIDLLITTPSPGWIVEICEADNVTLLTDNDGDGILDTGLLNPDQMITIKVKVTIPPSNSGDFDEITITARSSRNPNGFDTAVIRTNTYPHIDIYKSASEDEIWLNGTGMFPQATRITLEVKGSGLPITEIFPQDTIFCIDSSGSMSVNDPYGLRKDAAKSYVDLMFIPDRGAVVDFDCFTTLLHGLSSDYSQIKEDIDSINNYEEEGTDGNTYMAPALEAANDELINNADPTHFRVIIILTDGAVPESDVTAAYDEAYRAKDNDIVIYFIALGVTPPYGDWMSTEEYKYFKEIPEITGGKLYWTDIPEALVEIYREIANETIIDTAGKDMILGDEVHFVKDVLPPWIDLVPNSFNVYPDNITVNESGYTIIEWEVEEVLVGETLKYSFDVVSNIVGSNVSTNYVPDSRIRYVNWNDNEVEQLFPEVNVTVKLGPPSPPKLFNRVVGDDVQLYWNPPEAAVGLDHYLIYRAPIQTSFDFSTPWINTSNDSDGSIIPLRTTWNITDAAQATYNPREEYYIIRAVNIIGAKSVTSNTVGKFTKFFYNGVDAFSLPLEPFDVKTTDWYTNNIPNCNYIKWMSQTSHKWVQHDVGEGLGEDDIEMVPGEGYEISVGADSAFTFCGRPGAHIRYREGELPPPTNFEANVVNAAGDVKLTWDPVIGADHYLIYRSSQRDGLNNLSLPYRWETNYYDPDDTIYIDFKAVSIEGTQWYYMVVAVSDPSIHIGFNSTYSIGVWTEKILAQYDTLGLPLKPNIIHSTDWYCDDIPNVLGMNYYNITEQRWMWHKTIMPSDVYDVEVKMAEGYQLSTTAGNKFWFIGV